VLQDKSLNIMVIVGLQGKILIVSYWQYIVLVLIFRILSGIRICGNTGCEEVGN
jgi:hypothetical protein